MDLAEAEVIRVGDTFYYSASNMHHPPGAPPLRLLDHVSSDYTGRAVFEPDWAAP
jgi:hypothetical protein